jgi:enoyl-CoA hydratase
MAVSRKHRVRQSAEAGWLDRSGWPLLSANGKSSAMPEVDLTIERRIAIVTLNRPEKRNAITLPMQRALIAALEDVGSDEDVGALVLTGAGGDFCVGGDHAVIERMDAERGFLDTAAAQHRRTIELLFALDIPIFAAIEGAAFSFGAELAACCDIVLMGETARLADLHVRFGLPPAPVTLMVWPLLTSRLAAVELVVTGREVPAAEAVTLGLASRVVRAGSALAEALALAKAIVAVPRDSVTLTKRALRLQIEDLDRFYPDALRY